MPKGPGFPVGGHALWQRGFPLAHHGLHVAAGQPAQPSCGQGLTEAVCFQALEQEGFSPFGPARPGANARKEFREHFLTTRTLEPTTV